MLVNLIDAQCLEDKIMRKTPVLALAFLAGCTGSTSSSALDFRGAAVQYSDTLIAMQESALATLRPIANRARSRAASYRHAFLSDAAMNIVTVFDGAGKTHTLTGFTEPQGIATDRAGTLYIANTESRNVEEFVAPYEGTPNATIAEPNEYPVTVAVSLQGIVAAINICGGSGSQCTSPGSVYFYPNSTASTPCAIVSAGSKISRLLSGAFDAGGTLYVAGENDYTTSRIGEVAGGCGATTLSLLKPSDSVTFAAGVQVDRSGNIAIVDSRGFSGSPLLKVYAPPKDRSEKITLLTQSSLVDSSIVVSFAFRKDGRPTRAAAPRRGSYRGRSRNAS